MENTTILETQIMVNTESRGSAGVAIAHEKWNTSQADFENHWSAN